jgi:hypothetical protein
MGCLLRVTQFSAIQKRWNGNNAQGRCDKADEIADDAPAQRKDHGVARASVQEEEVLDRCFAFATFRGLARGDRVR